MRLWLELHHDKQQMIREQPISSRSGTLGEPLEDVVDRNRDAFLVITSSLDGELEATKRKLEATTADTRVLQDSINALVCWREAHEATIDRRLDGVRRVQCDLSFTLAKVFYVLRRPLWRKFWDWMNGKDYEL